MLWVWGPHVSWHCLNTIARGLYSCYKNSKKWREKYFLDHVFGQVSKGTVMLPALGHKWYIIFLASQEMSLHPCNPILLVAVYISIYSIKILAPLYILFREGNDTPLQYSYLENPVDGGAWQATVHGVAKSRTRLSDFTFTFHFHHWRRKWQPTPVFLPGESQGLGSLVGCCLWGRTESDTTKVT